MHPPISAPKAKIDSAVSVQSNQEDLAAITGVGVVLQELTGMTVIQSESTGSLSKQAAMRLVSFQRIDGMLTLNKVLLGSCVDATPNLRHIVATAVLFPILISSTAHFLRLKKVMLRALILNNV